MQSVYLLNIIYFIINLFSFFFFKKNSILFMLKLKLSQLKASETKAASYSKLLRATPLKVYNRFMGSGS